MEGKIARLLDKGYGFIKPEGSEFEKDLFFHANDLKDVEFNDLREGDKVTFEIEEGPKGKNAVEINKK